MGGSDKPARAGNGAGPYGGFSLSYGPIRYQPSDGGASRPPPRLKALADATASLRSLLLNFVFFALLILLGFIVWGEFGQEEVRIEQISVPEDLMKRGYSEQIIVSRLRDSIQEIERFGERFFALAKVNRRPQSVLMSPDREKLEVVIPEIGMSARSLVRYAKTWITPGTKISGEFICNSTPCKLDSMALRLRIDGNRQAIVDVAGSGKDSEDTFIFEASEKILRILDPIYIVEYAYERGNVELASEVAQEMIDHDHGDKVWALNALGVIYNEQQQYEAAISHFERAIIERSETAILHVNAGISYWLAGKLDTAREALDQAIAIDQSLTSAWTALGYLLLDLEQPTEAVGSFERAVSSNARDADAYNGLGNALVQLRDLEAASRAYQEATRLNPDHVFAHFNLGGALLHQGRLDDAIASFEEAIRLDSDAAAWLRENGELANALPTVLSAGRFLRGHSLQLYALAELALKVGDNETAIRAARAYLQRAPGGERAHEAAEIVARLSGSAVPSVSGDGHQEPITPQPDQTDAGI